MNDPMAQLERCHRRLEEACDALAVAVHDRDVETIGGVTAFLGRQIRRHEDDEEGSLFPRLQGVVEPEVASALERLAVEHREHERLQSDLEGALAARDTEPETMWSHLATIADAVTRAYRAHVELEERVVFPAARSVLSPSAVEAIAEEMEARRGRGRAPQP